MVDLLLNDLLVGGVVGVKDFNTFPTSLSLVLVLGLESQTGNDNGQSQTLSVHTSLNKLLLTAKIRVSTDDSKSSTH